MTVRALPGSYSPVDSLQDALHQCVAFIDMDLANQNIKIK
jgi:hypothetical protein